MNQSHLTDNKADILIVDDDLNNLQMLSDTLRTAGYDVRGARNGRAALDFIANDPPDLVLLDVRMPDMDGYEVCRQLKSDKRYANLPVIFLSALQAVEDRIQGFEAGAVDYINKPFQTEEVLARVRTHVSINYLQKNLKSEVYKQTAALRESEKRYRTIFEASLVSIMAIRENRFLAVNTAACRMLGFAEPEEMIGMPVMNVVAPSSRSMIEERIKRLETGEHNPLAEVALVCKDGREITVESSSVAVSIDGMLTAMVFAQDISQRKIREQQLQKMQFTIDHAMDRIAWIAPDGRFIYANEAGYKDVQLPYEKLLAMRVPDIDPEFPQDKWDEHYQELKKKGGMRLQTHHIDGKGQIRYLDISSKYFKYDKEEFICSFGRDITALKQAEQALKEQLEFELLIADIAARLTQTDSDKLGETIDSVLLSLCQALHTERSFLAQCSQDGQKLRHTNICTIEGFSVPTNWYELEIAGDFPWIMQQLQNDLVINTGPGLTGLPDEASELRGWLEDQAIQSGLVVPVRVEGTLVGMLGMESLRQPREYPSSIVDRLKIVADMMGTTLHRHRAEKKIDEQLRFEDLISRLSATFIHIKASEIDDTIERGLGLVASFLNLQRCNLFLFSEDKKTLHLTVAYAVEGVEASPKILYSDEQPWFTNRLLSGEPYCFSSPEELPPEAAAEKAYLQRVGVKSAILMPLVGDGESHGGITLSSLTVERQWPDKLMQQLRTVADVFANAMLRQRAHGIIEQRLAIEALLAKLATGFINLAIEETDHYLINALRNISLHYGYDRSSILLFNQDASELIRSHMWERDGIKPDPEGLPVKVHLKFPGLYNRLKNGETVIVPNAETMQDVETQTYCRAIGIQSFVMVPMMVSQRNLGAIVFSAIHSRTSFGDEQVKQLRLFSTIVASALVRLQTQQALEKSQDETRHLTGRLLSIQENERKHLARELHDDLSQRLAVLAMSASQMRTKLTPLAPETADGIQNMRLQLVKLSEDIHAISRQLHPSILEDLGLVDAARNECKAFSRRSGIRLNYQATGIPERLPKETALCFFRIIQEGLRNIAKHARADTASIVLSCAQNDLLMEIADTGCGFDLNAARNKSGLGLISMNERVKMIDGHIEIGSSPGEGTRIRVSAPLPAPEASIGGYRIEP